MEKLGARSLIMPSVRSEKKNIFKIPLIHLVIMNCLLMSFQKQTQLLNKQLAIVPGSLRNYTAER